ncbi:MAG TPA: extracellular solute-binding protein, partial [Candidatus Limnocylindrales bacterium]|nr:extracellular solute-binding protein [Candidatus Limnocylindrales bacterium]
MTTTRALPRVLTLGVATLIVVAACSQAPGGSTAPTTGTGTGGSYAEFVPPADLLAAAKTEGTLTTIALPHDWCNYGQIEGAAPNPQNVIDVFKARTGLAVNELNPLAGSGDEIEAIKANKDNKGPQAPDVIDVGLAFGPSSKDEGLLMPYKVATWDTIPADVKDADGAWYGDYYGVFSFEVNKSLVPNVPQDWADLLKDEYKGKIALPGDPRASSQAILAVFASGLANGGSLDDATKGLDFFKQLKDKGNLIPGVIANATTVANGETPITIRWTYNALAGRDATAAAGGPEISVVVPASGRFGGVYVQGISAYAPHPNAAKLWEEFLYSDEGQNMWLRGYCHPIRYPDLVKNNKVPADQLAKLPDVTGTVFPTLA